LQFKPGLDAGFFVNKAEDIFYGAVADTKLFCDTAVSFGGF
jgi:hypothetical protein